MKNDNGTSNPGDAAELRKNADALRDALLRLHKILIESERAEYEQTMGTIQSPSHFLHLLTTDPWFAWLHPISRLIVTIDESQDGELPLTQTRLQHLITETRVLLVASESGEGFPQNYHAALQRDPDVIMAHAEVIQTIGHSPRPDPENRSD